MCFSGALVAGALLIPTLKALLDSEVFRHSNSTEVAGVHEVIINRIRASIFRVRSVFPESSSRFHSKYTSKSAGNISKVFNVTFGLDDR